MKKEQRLYIDGVLMDLSDDVEITLDIKSNLFRDVTKITANNTYTVNLPKTVHNMCAIDWAAKPKNGSRYPYAFHMAQYFRNGLEVIKDGRATLMSIGDNIEISIYWGVFPAFSKLQENDLKLNELKTDEYVLFKKYNEPSSKEDAKKKGIFYAFYNPYHISSTEGTYGVNYTRNTPDTSKDIDLKVGYIKTGEELDAYIGGIIVDDSSWRCAIVPFYPTMTAYIQASGYGSIRAYAVLDKNGRIIELASEQRSPYKPISMTIKAGAQAAFLVINVPSEYWNDTQSIISGAQDMRVLTDVWNEEEDFTGDTVTYTDIYKTSPKYLQPCVTVSWILNLIKNQTGVIFSWDDESAAFLENMVVPLVTSKADENTIVGKLSASINAATKLGTLSFDLTSNISSIQQKSGTALTKIDITEDCKLHFDLQARTKKKFQGYVGESYMNDLTEFFVVKVVSYENGETSEQENEINGAAKYEDGQFKLVTWKKSEATDGYVYDAISGCIDLELKKNDVVSFIISRTKFGESSEDIDLYAGTITATIQTSDNVPIGGMFPIGINLPDMTVTDFIKFLSLVTGTFPKQIGNNGSVDFVEFDAIWNNRAKAIDLTRKLIPYEGRNTVRKMEFSVSDYKQHNRYKWKEDDETPNEDADLQVANTTLDYEQDTWTLPFAASLGNRIPLRTVDGVGAKSGGEYKGCKDRIMTFRNTDYSSLEFGIDLQRIFETKYSKLAKTLANAHVITEWLNLSDLDILNFDETVPVYFAQYGAYFAVIELKTASNGYTEATMLQLEF